MEWMDRIAPGVKGLLLEEYRSLWIAVLMAEHPGSGDVSRYLDALDTHRTIYVPNVISTKLAGMLARRGFVPHATHLPELEEIIDVWVRERRGEEITDAESEEWPTGFW